MDNQGPLTSPLFEGPVVQCEDVRVSWTGGQYPVRVEAFYQPDSTSDWKIAGLPSEAADSNVILWNANVPAGTYAWITIVDHSGTYRQSPQGVLVTDSGNASCLDNAKTASVITQTVFMSTEGAGYSFNHANGLDDKALLILTVVFGILAFAALAIATWLFSRLRQARRARMRGPRFSLTDEDYLGQSPMERRSHDGGSLAGNALYGAAGFAGGKNDRSRRTSSWTDAGATQKGSTAATFKPDKDYRDEKTVPSPDTSHGEHNPFLDPPLSAGSDGTTHHRYPSYQDDVATSPALRQHGIPAPAAAPGRMARPDIFRNTSTAATMSSATSMQIFETMPGQLRVMNDPSQIATPTISRAATRSSESSRYPESTVLDGQSPSDDAATTHARPDSSAGSHDATHAPSQSGHTYLSIHSTKTDSTADHYASEPHSSRGYLNSAK